MSLTSSLMSETRPTFTNYKLLCSRNRSYASALMCDTHNFAAEDWPDRSVGVDDLSGAPGWLACLRLATNCHAHNVTVRRRRAGPDQFELVTARSVRSGEQLAVWFDAELSHQMAVPFLGLRNIQGGGRYGCHLCGQLFQQPNPLKLHLAVESLVSSMGRSSKGHVCLYCGKLYSRKYGLKIHIRTHTGYKPLHCRVCARPFGDPSNLNKHVRLHADGETPYRCDRCGKVLVRRRDLERHIRSRHGQATSQVTEALHRQASGS
ncbi:zinc finger protein Gfi-1-like [Pollicipes pollicipes]|uniref:zinc finger protein Gfi-1-like n=1 Tax=Pollicipes pollicipes TaxID=41117 RepID=UPI001885802C|nr:zinc finger protein Gfi-1-like [Pollicipes pollicipes]